MFTHPALLRELNTIAELLRLGGETERARTVVQAADLLRRSGWTPAGAQAIKHLRATQEAFSQTGFGAGHARWSPVDLERMSDRLRRHWDRSTELASLPTEAMPVGLRQRSPDLGPALS